MHSKNNFSEVFTSIRSGLVSQITSNLRNNFAPKACALLAFSSPLYTGETRNSWGFNVYEGVSGNIKVIIGNTANQAVFCEYGTKSKLVATKLVTSSLITGVLVVKKDNTVNLDKKPSNGKDDVLKWCDFKGIYDNKVRNAIVHSILTKGINPTTSQGGLAGSLPELIKLYKRVIT